MSEQGEEGKGGETKFYSVLRGRNAQVRIRHEIEA